MRWWKWFAVAAVLWTLGLVAVSYSIHDPRECGPLAFDGNCDALRQSETAAHVYGTVAVWVLGIAVGATAWFFGTRE